MDFRLGEDFSLTSYQVGLGVDSALVLSGGGVNILNANDCKLFGWPLRQIQKKFRKFDFVLRSHSNASALPYCVEDFRILFPTYRSQGDYIDEFCLFSLALNARYAVPFASNHCFLHRETIRFNSMSVSPVDIPSRYRELAKKYSKNSECIVMSPGDAWSQRNGFDRTPFDYLNRDSYIAMLGEKHKKKLEYQYCQEDQTLASFDLFREYFSRFVKSIPMVLRIFLNLRVQFRVCDSRGVNNWLIDAVRGKVVILGEDECQFPVIQTPALVLNDCCSKRMFSAWTPSKRLKIYLRSDSDLRVVQVFFFLLDLYELDTLPLRKNVSWRGFSTRVPRWRELLEVAKLFCKHVLLRRRFALKNLYRL